jgi:DNA adenine methylase
VTTNYKTTKYPRPFLKWAGGKSSLLPHLCSLVPSDYLRYIEPFLGGGALFFELQPKNAVLSDLNSELINCYKIVRDKPEELNSLLKTMPVSKEYFYQLRSQDIATLTTVERAARLLFLNKTCYNGLYRVNKKGQFNTPFGSHKIVNICNYENLKSASATLKDVKELIDEDFEIVLLKFAKEGDFIYLDPPYPSIGQYSDFKRYTKQFFGKEEHYRLARVVKEIDKRGCKFILSNPKHELVGELYDEFRKIDVEAPRFINCRGSKRGNVPEILITNIGKQETSLSTNKIHGKQTELS